VISEGVEKEPTISKVNCGGRQLTLVKAPPPEVLPFIVSKLVALKLPYLHYRVSAA
jgi:hypothetical protein